MKKMNFKEFDVTLIINKKLKNSYIQIQHNNTILVKTPSQSQKFVLHLLQNKEAWIRKQLLKNKDSLSFDVNIEDEVLFFGEVLSIDDERVLYLSKKLQKIQIDSKEKVLKAYDDFYKYNSKIYLAQRTQEFAKLMNLSFTKLNYRKMKSRWGSCSSHKNITLNTQLIKLPKKLIDYVIVHELSHLVHMNHSKKFHSLVEQYLPNSKEYRAQLKNHYLK